MVHGGAAAPPGAELLLPLAVLPLLCPGCKQRVAAPAATLGSLLGALTGCPPVAAAAAAAANRATRKSSRELQQATGVGLQNCI